MKYLPLIFIFLSINSLSGQLLNKYVPGTIYFLDGGKYDCNIGFPITNPIFGSNSHISVTNLLHKKERIRTDEIDYVAFNTATGYFKLVWTYGYTYNRRNKKKKSKEKSWFLLKDDCEDFYTFSWADKYQLFKVGGESTLYISYGSAGGLFYIMGSEEDFPTYLCPMTNTTGFRILKYNKKLFENYFEGDVHAMNYLEGKTKLRATQIQDYIGSRCSEIK